MARKDALLNLRSVLLRRRDAMRRALAGDLSLLKEMQDEISSQLAEVESRELAHIENALERLGAGSYGQCEHCGEKIPLARLQALPYATSCIRCKRKAERGHAGGIPDLGHLAGSDASLRDVDFV